MFRTRREGRGHGGAARCRGVPRTGPTARWHLGPEWGAGITGPGQRAASSAVRQPSCTRVATKGLVYLFFFPPPRLVLPAGGGGVRQAGSWRVLSLLSDLLRRPPPAVTSARAWDRATATSPEVWPLGLGAVCPGEPHQHLNACLGSREAPKCHRQSPGRCDGDARGDVANIAGQLPAPQASVLASHRRALFQLMGWLPGPGFEP